MSLSVTTYESSAAFLERAETYLHQEEPVNLHLLSLCATISNFPRRRRNVPFMATVEDGEALAAAAVIMPPKPITIYCSLADARPALSALIGRLQEEGRVVWGVIGPARDADQFAAIWEKDVGGMVQPYRQHRIYIRTEPKAFPPIDGNLRLAGADDFEQIVDWIKDSPETRELGGDPEVVRIAASQLIQNDDAYVWDNKGIVAMVAQARRTERGMSLGQVFTEPASRRQGYAAAALATLGNKLITEGWEYCIVMADLSYPHAEAVCQAAGYESLQDFVEYRFSG